ncbi:MAG TPA: hypothetical protein VN937_28425 [Blastocatellia bacterium]|nr:hypothetical protein [Blastocatellia bacterium]
MKRRVQIVTLLLVVAIVLPACNTNKVVTPPGKPRDENLIRVALATSDVAKSVTLAIQVKRALLKDKKITKETSAKLTDVLIKITKANDELAKRSATFETFSPTAKSDLCKLFQELEQAVRDLIQDGTIKANPIFNEAKVGIDIALTAVRTLCQ